MTHHEPDSPSLRVGLAVLAGGLALGATSAVAVANALYDVVR